MAKNSNAKGIGLADLADLAPVVPPAQIVSPAPVAALPRPLKIATAIRNSDGSFSKVVVGGPAGANGKRPSFGTGLIGKHATNLCRLAGEYQTRTDGTVRRFTHLAQEDVGAAFDLREAQVSGVTAHDLIREYIPKKGKRAGQVVERNWNMIALHISDDMAMAQTKLREKAAKEEAALALEHRVAEAAKALIASS